MTTDMQQSTQENQNRYQLRNRYVFTGQLVMQTALHIGGGRITTGNSDSPVVLTPDLKPFIPGSSFKGSLRSTVEKLVPGLPGFSTCALIELNEEEIKAAKQRDEKLCSTLREKEFAQERRNRPASIPEINQRAIRELCDTCRLFGSPFAAAHLNISDLYMPKGEWNGAIQTRDGVAIDRDSEKAKDRLKYDFEVVPVSTTFELEIVLENATPKDIQLVCVGLSEFVHGFGVIGGKRSRGLGVCKLENLQVQALELERDDLGNTIDKQVTRQRLRDFLIRKQFSSKISGSDFLARHIEFIFNSEEK